MSLLTCENVVKNVEPRKVTVKGNEKIIYDAIDKDDVKWTIWERPLAEQVYALIGQPTIWKVAIDQNGDYTNRTLKEISVKAAGGFEPALTAMEASLGNLGTMSLGTATSGLPETAPNNMVEGPSFKDRNIWRQCATKVAAVLSQTDGEFWGNVDDLVRYYETGTKPGNPAAQALADQYLPSGLATQPETFAPQTDDDIPF